MKCWCGTKNAYFEPIREGCGGLRTVQCMCGGDFCVCHNHGEVECFGCEDCEGPENDDDWDYSEDEAEYLTEVPA